MRYKEIAISLALLPLSAQACTLNFTSPGDGSTTRSAAITIYGQGGASAQFGNFGTVIATLNGQPFYNYSGSFTTAITFLQTRGVPVTLRPGINVLSVTGSVGSCSASDTMTIMYDPEVTLNKNKGTPPPIACVGNPINVSVGNKFQRESDYYNSSSPLLKFDRLYNSLDGYWRHSLSTRLVIATGATRLVEEDGREITFTKSGSNWISSSDEFGKLSSDGTGWLYISKKQSTYQFNSAGELKRVTNSSGRFISLNYSPTGITVIADTGESFVFTQDSKFQPLTLVTSDFSVDYKYDQQSRLKSISKNFGGVILTRIFHYENNLYPRFLTGITDENGDRYISWEYDQFGRAISSSKSGGAELTQVTYNADGSATVKNSLGRKSVYHFKVIQGVKKIVAIDGEASANCPFSNSEYEYNAQGLQTKKIDSNGNITTYSYDPRGLEISRTEASGTAQARTINTTWHPNWFLPTSIVEPGRITEYTYDIKGRQISQSVTKR